MPIDYQRDDERQRLVVRAKGIVALEETLAIMDRQAADGAWSYAVLYDAREVERGMTAGEVQQMLQHVRTLTATHGPRGPVALIIGNPEPFNAARRYAMLGELSSMDVELFPTVEAAELWLQTVKRA